jgi:hypothetical protein
VKAESPGVAWSVWCADFLGHFGIRTIERYIALIEPPKPTADDDAGAVEATADAVTTAPRRNAGRHQCGAAEAAPGQAQRDSREAA